VHKSDATKLEAATEITLSLSTQPYAFKTLCDTLKESQVTEVDFSSCGLGPPAMEILGDYVRDATAALARLTLKENKEIGASGADPLMESICSTRNTCIVSIEHDVGALV